MRVPIFICLLLFSCQTKKTELTWDQSLSNIGSQSSPRVAELTGDGVLDIVMGAGKAEIAETDHGVIALNGATGELLWKQPAIAQMVGSATFYDITEDGTPEVFIGGRNSQLMALEGKTGEVLWQYEYAYEDDSLLKYARFNFYNSQLVPDQNEDGFPDLLTVNGGNWDALPDSTNDRFPGVLMLFSLKDGIILAADTMPDGKESYMSPICFRKESNGPLMILFGTGGETVPGSLYLTPFADFLQKNLAASTVLSSEEGHGYIAPPAVADVNGDGVSDILTVSHATTVSAIDGDTYQILWKHHFPGFESSNSPAIGQFTGSERPDVLAVLSRGKWPFYGAAQQVMIDGETGEIAYQDSLGCFALSSPVVYDLDRDGFDEAIFSVNQYACNIGFNEDQRAPKLVSHRLTFVNFQKGNVQIIDDLAQFINIFSTPWIGDLDGDGFLDFVYCQYYNPQDIYRFMGMRVRRISSSIRIHEPVRWGGYMGSHANGIWDNQTMPRQLSSK